MECFILLYAFSSVEQFYIVDMPGAASRCDSPECIREQCIHMARPDQCSSLRPEVPNTHTQTLLCVTSANNMLIMLIIIINMLRRRRFDIDIISKGMADAVQRFFWDTHCK